MSTKKEVDFTSFFLMCTLGISLNIIIYLIDFFEGRD